MIPPNNTTSTALSNSPAIADKSTTQPPPTLKISTIPDLNTLPLELEATSETDLSLIDDWSLGEEFLVAVSLSRKWAKWSVEAILPGVVIRPVASYMCSLHDRFLDAKIIPVDDICEALPTTLIENKRFNAVGGFVIHCKREVKSGRAVRTVSNTEYAKWKVRDASQAIAGEDGVEVGTCYPLVLMYKPDHRSNWHAFEFVSSNSKGDTSVVFLTCKNRKLGDLEMEVLKQERKRDRCLQKCADVKKKKSISVEAVEAAEVALFNARASLGRSIAKLDQYRKEIKDLEDELCGAVAGGRSDISVASRNKVKVDVSQCAKLIEEGGSAAAGRVIRHAFLNTLKDNNKKKEKKGNQHQEGQ